MPVCIWNDRCYKLIEEKRDKFNAVEYTVVRKLFVRWNTDGPNAQDEISSAFRSFGEIESVEIVKDEVSKHTTKYTTKHTVTQEAYVSFVKSEDAYGALSSQFYPKNLLYSVPADTWRQPEYKEVNEDQTKIVLKCNHICKMNSITREFNDLSLNQNTSEMICEHTVIDYEMKLKPATTLDYIRRTLRSVMKHVADLKLIFYTEFDKHTKANDEQYIDEYVFQRRVFEVIGKNALGPKLKILTIDGLSGISKVMFECLAPILKPLTELNIFTVYSNILYLLPPLCPNLTSLQIIGRKWEAGGNVPVQSWPTLGRLEIKGISLHVDSDTESGKRFRYFVSLNPQLETLVMDVIVDNSLLKAIGKSVRNLKSLNLTRKTFDGIGGMNDQLVRLKRLESIYVNTLHLHTNHFKSLLSFVECLSNKKRLKMATLVQNYVLNEHEPFLIDESVPIKYHDGCVCHGDNRAITFNDESQNDVVNLPKHKPALAIMVNVARHLKHADKTLDSRIHTMFKGMKKFYPNVLKTTVVEEPNRFVYIHISGN